MFQGKKRFLEFKQRNPSLSNTVLSDTLKNMESNGLIKRNMIIESNKEIPEYYLTDKGLKLNRILYDLAVYGLDELECDEEEDYEILSMFKEYYADMLNVR